MQIIISPAVMNVENNPPPNFFDAHRSFNKRDSAKERDSGASKSNEQNHSEMKKETTSLGEADLQLEPAT